MFNHPAIRLKLTAFIISILLFCSCGQNNDGEPAGNLNNEIVDTLAIINDPKNNLNVQTNTFSEIDSSGIIMFPLAMGEAGRNGDSYSYKEIPYNSYWNIIFYNSATTEYHPLTNKKLLIRSIDLDLSSDDNVNIYYITKNKPFTKYIFYKVTLDDFNQDKHLTHDDPEYLFVSDKVGNNFRQLSPTGLHVKSWKYLQSTNKIIMTVTKDSNKNNKFGDEDEVSSYQIDIDKDRESSEIFSAEFKKKLKVLFDKDWKRTKKPGFG